ncbi:GNAT family N-acetyltransferase [Undibacterium sp. TJN19]|uniref:GNAT family N-acetyltransferase n=1 Tax=Undibacterium sp. TJN19 TaxID=3413055 RepID=UPI003BF39F67
MSAQLPPVSNTTDLHSETELKLAGELSTQPETLRQLSRSASGKVRAAVAMHAHTPDDILQTLMNDQNPEVIFNLRKRGCKLKPVYLKPQEIIGNKLRLRNAGINDARFIISLRTDATKARFLSATSPDVEQQVRWLEKYALDTNQIYFIIQNAERENIGTVRLYDQQANSFCWGSWIIQAGAANSSSIESALLVYHFALALGFEQAHFDVRKGNESVWKFHERFGAQKIRETAEDFHYTLNADAIRKSLEKYAKFLPDGIQVLF